MNKRGSVCLKLHFPIGLRRILAAIGTDWHRNDAMVCTLGKWKSSFRSLRSQIRFGLTTDLIPVLILGSIGIGKRCFESQNISTNSNPFAGGLLLSRESSKVSFELPEGFSVTAEKWQQQGMFWVTQNLSGYSPKALLPVAPPKSGNLNIEKEDIGLFLISSLLAFLKNTLSPLG